MAEPLLLGIDLGTSSVKALLVHLDGRAAGSAAAEYPILQPHATFAEQNPDDWWRATTHAVRQVVEGTGNRNAIAAIGLSGQMHGTVVLDGRDQPLTSAIIWPDQRSARQVDEIKTLVGAEQLYRIAGSPVSTGFQAATLRWLQQELPDIWRQVRMILLPKDYLRWRLTGRFASDPSDAAGTLLLDQQQRDWSTLLLDLLGIEPSQLPRIQPAASVAGQLTRSAAEALGLAEGVPVVTGAADTACSALGAGCTGAGRLLLTISTGGQLIQPVERVAVDMLGRIHTFCSAVEPTEGQAGWYQMGAILAAGMALRWLRDNVFAWHYPDAYDIMNLAGESSPPGAHELLFLPYLVGERTPHMDPSARGVFFGLTLRHHQGDLVRAVMEGVVFACYDAYQVLVQLGVASDRVILAGGGAKSPLWRQIVADVFALPVQSLLAGEQSARGAALLAGAGIGIFDLVDTAKRWVQLGPVAEPETARHRVYQERFGAFRELYERNKGHFA